MKTIIVTGTPGTGKTQLAGIIAKKFNFYHIDVNRIIKKYNIAEGYDRKRKTKIIDTNKLNNTLIKEINQIKKTANKVQYNNKSNKKIIPRLKNTEKINGIIIDSHLSHYLPKKYVDLCMVAKCNIRELKKRLEKRKYQKSKIEENLQAEIFDICLVEANEKGHKVLAADTTNGIDVNLIRKSIINMLK